MATPFRLKRSAVPGKRPTLNDLQLGELALNTYDGYLWAERDTGGVGIGTTIALLTPWTENFGGSSIYYQNLVGIGTDNPLYKLHVEGNIFAGSNNRDTYLLAYSDSSAVGNISIEAINKTNTTKKILALNAYGGNVLVGSATSTGIASQTLQVTGGAYVSGSVGIATTNPVNTLQVLGGITAGDGSSETTLQSGFSILRPNDSTPRTFAIVENETNLRIGGGAWNNVNIRTAPSNQVRVAITSSGNVGIASTSPTSRLDVVGDAKVSGVVTATTFVGQINAGVGTITTLTSTNVNLTNINSTGISTLSTVSATQISVSGIITASLLNGNLNAPGKTLYVSKNGSDSNSGTNINKPFATLLTAINAASSGDTILIGSGTFTEAFPLIIPKGVTVRGAGLRATFIEPTPETKQSDGFLLDGETTVEDLSIGNVYEPGYAFKFVSNAKTTTRSPYVQRVTVLNKGSVITSTDPYGFDTPHSPPSYYKAGRGVLIDGGVVDPTTLEPAMLFNECTFITPNNTALEMTNGARTEWVNCFTYLADKGIYAYDGNLGLGNTGYVRIKTSGFTTTSSTPAANDELYYLEANSQSGTYAQVGTALTITRVGHGLTVGDRIFADFTSGTATDGFYRVTEYVGVNTFSVTMVGSATTSGNVSYKEALGFGTVRSYTSATGLSSITGKGEGLFELPTSRLGKTVTAYGNASLSTAQKKFGTASLALDGNGDYVYVASNSDFAYGTGDFTIELWFYPNNFSTFQVLVDQRISAPDNAPYIDVTPTTGLVRYTAASTTITSNTALNVSNWNHIAISRSSGTTRMFINGTLQSSTFSDSTNYVTSPLKIGGDYPGNSYWVNGYIDEFRISNNARYTGTFTPSTSAFESDGNDKLLLHFDGITGSTSFTDSSIPVQDIRWVRSGVGIASATRITLADYQQFGAEMRSIGSAAVFGNTGISADGPGVGLRLFAFNFGHIGSGKDFSQDVSLVNQEAEVVKTNNANVYFVSIDQSGDFRVGDAFYVNQEAGTVNFGGQNFTLNSLSDLNITDGVNTNTITPTTATIGNIQISGNEITSTSGNININPSGTSETNVDGNLNVSGILTASVLQTGALQLDDTSIAIDDTGLDGTIRFNTDGTEAARITNQQRFGIGTVNPQTSFEVVSDSPGGGIRVSATGSNSPGFRLYNNDTGAFAQNILALTNGAGLVGSVAGDYCIRNSSGGGILLGISTALGITSPNQAIGYVRLTPSGELLVGTSSTIATGTASQPLQVTGGAYVSGNLGIGTINPVYKLQVKGQTLLGGNSADAYFAIYDDNNGDNISLEAYNLANSVKKNITLNAYGGSVGVGTTNPQVSLDVVGDINSSSAVKVNGVSVVQSAVDEALALAIALG